MITIHSTRINGIATSYLLKEGSGPVTVLFIHGFPFNKQLWEAQLPALPDEVRGIAYDIRGFGDSESGSSFFTIDLFARDVEALVSGLKLDKVVLCGISMGGYIALRAFERNAGLYAGLILCDTTAAADNNEAKLNRFASIETVQEKGVEPYAAGFVKKIFSETTLTDRPEAVARISEMIVTTPVTTICSSLLAMASRTETTALLPSVDVPALVIRGEDDQVIPAVQTDLLQQSIPGAVIETIDAAGHLPNVENPEAFNRAMNRFLQRFVE
ncbi:alpha/beta fold hydrolase [Hufsiella ginkgonis]|uniref:Alpha/beta fold hydrolase n=1 Tax=Hufsiella ginkgonis TaxID=2695274 RepID=A0A7K1XSI0_9SPHI|nr:alpha/beta fold hydrolase [Hufsiella ginkgonis]MXV13860.1 alpha/beta fold hydrolase [Hufsiella ginkgonis]